MSSVRLRRSRVPYNQQPPATLRPVFGDGLGRGLLYAASVPHEAIHSRTEGMARMAPATANYPTYGAAPFLGKTVITDGTTANPLAAPSQFIAPMPPFTLMVNFRQVTQASQGTNLSFGGSGSGAGLALSCGDTNIMLTFGGVANYLLLSAGLTTGVDYTVVVTCTASGGTATAYVIRRDTKAVQVGSPSTVGTEAQPTMPLTIGAAYGGSSYVDPGNMHHGAFAVWDRALSPTEATQLLWNPYALWVQPDFGRPYSSGISGALLTVLDNAALSGSGAEIFAGALVAILVGDAMSAIGAETDTGALSAALSGVSLSALGQELFAGALAVTLGNAALAGSGALGLSGTLGASLAGTSLAANGAEIFAGTLASTLGNDAMAASGSISNQVTGALNILLSDDHLFATNMTFVGGLDFRTRNRR